MRHLLVALTLLSLAGCEGSLSGPRSPGVDSPAPDSPVPDGGALLVAPDAWSPDVPDAAPALVDAGAPWGEDAGPIDVVPLEPDAGSVVRGALAPDLRITRVDLFQTVRVPLARSGVAADREGLPVVAGREALVRVHAASMTGWSPQDITAVIEIEQGGVTERFTDTRIPALPASDSDSASLFEVEVPAEAIEVGARFRVRLEAEGGVADAPDATYPTDGTFGALDAEDTGTPVVVLVPFRYETDGSGRMPEVGAAQLERIRDELTSRFPYADVVVRVHSTQTWSRANRYTGSVDWGAVNARLISMRDAEGAPETEYWYGLIAPDTSRSAYCARTSSCVTGQAYVATLRGSRVGSGVGFDDVASVRTLAHELGHEHGRTHTPCGTSSTDYDYPHDGGLTGVWGWDRRTGDFHDPDTASDMMGYCSRQWISDYTYRKIYERQMAMRAASWSVVGAPVARRFVTLEDGATSWGETTALRSLPGTLTLGTFVDGHGDALTTVEVSRLDFADSDGRTWIVPADAPAGARAIVIDGARLPLE